MEERRFPSPCDLAWRHLNTKIYSPDVGRVVEDYTGGREVPKQISKVIEAYCDAHGSGRLKKLAVEMSFGRI
jgi:hypothetical protein